jgi:hypothetical protein
MVFGEFNSNINSYGFVFGDLKYFDWFKNREHFEDKEIERFRNALVWKRLIHYTTNDTLGKTWHDYQIGNLDDYPVVTRAFLKHLRDPIKYPIFDKNVWKAMRTLRPHIARRTPENSQQAQYGHYENEYMPFFNRLYVNNENDIICPPIDGVDEGIVKRRVLDRALWTYGRILNNSQ